MAKIEFVDVVIIGAGFSGLSAANYLSSKSIKCLVIEGRPRVGGRTLSKKVLDDQWTIDLGGQWIGPNQERILSLIKQFNLELIEQTWHHHTPTNLGELIGLKPLNSIQFEQVKKINSQWDQMALELKSVEEAFNHDKSSSWSIISLEQYLEEHPLDLDCRVKQELKLEILTLTACNCDKVSLFYWLILICSIPGGLKSLDDGLHGAQHYKIIGGSQYVCSQMSINEDVRLNDPVQSVNYQLNDKILLTMNSGLQIECRRLLLGFSPSLLSRINFIPSFKLNNCCSMTMGQCIKTIFIYSKSFWRNVQLNECDEKGPCSNIFESTNPICLIGLILGDDALYWSDKNENELIESIRKQYFQLYQINEKPLETHIQYWTKEHLSQGCYAAVYPPSLSSTWLNKNKSLIDQRIWLASTEMALQWIGYIEGAIEAGQRFAQHIINSLEHY